jgi:hypothetical protein
MASVARGDRRGIRAVADALNLNPSQLAVVAVNARPLFAEEARKRQIAAGEHGKEGGRGNKKTLHTNRATTAQNSAASRCILIANASRARRRSASDSRRGPARSRSRMAALG